MFDYALKTRITISLLCTSLLLINPKIGLAQTIAPSEAKQDPLIPQDNTKDLEAFFAAIEADQIEVVQKFLKAKISPNSVNQQGQSPLHLGVKQNNLKLLRLLLDSGADVNQLNSMGLSPLFLAIETGHLETCKLFIQAGSKTSGDRYNPSALEYALRFKQMEIADYLVKHTQALKEKKPYDLLFSAVNRGNLEALKWLASQGLDLQSRGPGGETLLMEAPLLGGPDIVTYLVESGLDLNAKDNTGRTVLFYLAGSLRRPQMLTYLLEQGADVNAVASKETLNTPLLVAAHGGWYDNVLVLLEFGADTRAVDALGRNALAIVLTQGGATENELKKLVPLLLDVDLDVNHKDLQGDTPIQIALQQGELALVKKMLRQGVPLDIQSPNTAEAFLEAIHHNKIDTVRFLLSYHIPLSGPLYLDNLPLGQAASGDHLEILQLLLEEGADINGQDASGHTALHQACILGCKERIVRYLIQKGADPQITSKAGHTVLDLARNWKDSRVIEFLEAYQEPR